MESISPIYGSLMSTLMIKVNSSLFVLIPGRHKCREEWPDETLEKIYTVFLDIILLVLPLVIMAVKYGLITRTLWPATNNNEQSLNGKAGLLLIKLILSLSLAC